MFSYIFLYCKSLTKIVIPLSITAEAFGGSEALKNIVILPYVVSIGSGSFYDCISLNPPLHTLQSYNVSSLLPISSDLVSCNFFCVSDYYYDHYHIMENAWLPTNYVIKILR